MQLFDIVVSVIVTVLALMMMANWQRAPRGIRVMATRLGGWRVPAGILLIAGAALLVFAQR